MTQISSTNFTPKSKTYERNGEVVGDTIFPDNMQRVALAVEYDGTDYRGFQTQPNGVKTVQQAIEKALSKVADEKITLVCAGRTDAAVHATNQIIHFDALAVRPAKAWFMGTRPYLPENIRIHWAQNVSPQFHARFSAQSRTYRYLLSDADSPPALLHRQVSWSHRKLNVEKMQSAAEFLLGEHDFTSFRATQCQAKSPVRTIERLQLIRRGDLILLEIKANAFLHHMVRNIVGVLSAVGRGDQPIEWVAEVLSARDRTLASKTADPNGLYLVRVDYPSEFNIPNFLPGPMFFGENL